MKLAFKPEPGFGNEPIRDLASKHRKSYLIQAIAKER